MKKNSLAERTAAIRQEDLAAQILALHREAEKGRNATVAWARQTLISAIGAGEKLLRAQEDLGSDFRDWLETLAASDPEATFCRRTAFNYMRAVRYKDALGDECPDFGTLKDLYVAAGILPAPPEPGKASGATTPLFTLSLRVNGPPPEQWTMLSRREYLQKAKPVVDLYERLRAIEEAA